MTKSEILEFLNTNPNCHMATTEDDQPHVRALAMVSADESGIVFQSWIMKDIHKQLIKNPNVELCFNSKDTQVRVIGKIEIVDDIKLKKEVESKRPFMTPTIQEKGYESVAIYRLKNGKAHIWNFKSNFDPKIYIDL